MEIAIALSLCLIVLLFFIAWSLCRVSAPAGSQEQKKDDNAQVYFLKGARKK